MHVLVPIHAFEPGGVERVALRLAERWRAEGHEVTILLGRDRGLCRDQRPDLTYRCYAEPFPTAGWETLWMMACLVRYLLVGQADAIYCPGLTYTRSVLPAGTGQGEQRSRPAGHRPPVAMALSRLVVGTGPPARTVRGHRTANARAGRTGLAGPPRARDTSSHEDPRW